VQASGLSTPVGFQAVGDGGLAAELAVDAVRESGAAHAFLSVSKQGVAGIVETTGNRDCHVVLPPGKDARGEVAKEVAALRERELPTRVMVNCSAANGGGGGGGGPGSTQAEQLKTVGDVAELVSEGVDILGVLLPSFLLAGKQDLRGTAANKSATRIYGMSVTEPCMDWSSTADSLERLAAAVRQRRAANGAKRPRTE
jgi:3-deoxy-7-phosphoheptulonate synthase